MSNNHNLNRSSSEATNLPRCWRRQPSSKVPKGAHRQQFLSLRSCLDFQQRHRRSLHARPSETDSFFRDTQFEVQSSEFLFQAPGEESQRLPHPFSVNASTIRHSDQAGGLGAGDVTATGCPSMLDMRSDENELNHSALSNDLPMIDLS